MTKAAGFEGLGLDERLLTTLGALGYEEPTPIQREAIPALLTGSDVIGQAATGTGKTAAFSLPLVQKLAAKGKRKLESGKPWALILVPTRELAVQVAVAVHRAGRGHDLRAVAIDGGQGYELQVRGLHRGVDVLIATPGRAIDHLKRGTLLLDAVEVAVLDEVDEMLDMGFIDDIQSILDETPDTRQVVLFSATLPPRIGSIAKKYLKDPIKVTIGKERVAEGAKPKVRQTAYVVHRPQKLAALSRLLDVEEPQSSLVFCRTRLDVDELADALNARGHRSEGLHGGMSQVQRERVIRKLKDGKLDLVIATDVAARGLDIDSLSHVFNFDVPMAAEDYVHRIGRVGRAGREGVALTLVDPREYRLMRNIEFATKQKIEVARVPSVADMQQKQLAQLSDAVREAAGADDVERFRAVVDGLTGELDIVEVALAALKVAYDATAPKEQDMEEIREPQARPPREFGDRAGARGPAPRGAPQARGPRPSSAGFAKIYIGVGRAARVLPKDLVGAITGEAGIAGKAIGVIDIADRFSLVEIAEPMVEDVLSAMRGKKIKGVKVVVRRDKEA
jgi:ATP-dependent RNA helicase DeaD